MSPSLVISSAGTAKPLELAIGLAAVEEGDDRIRPGAALHLGINEHYATRFYLWGREFGPVKEDTYLLSAFKRWSLFKTNMLYANLGVAVMNERIQVRFKDPTAQGENTEEDNINVGGVFGVTATLPKTIGPLYMSLSWDSHIFPAGLNGGLLLSSGRKQTIMLNMGAVLR